MKKKCKWIIGSSIIVLLVLGLVCFGIYSSTKTEDRFDLREYEGVFCAMYDMDNISEEYFVTYRGLKIKKESSLFHTGQQLLDYVNRALDAKADLKAVYLGLEPVMLWQEAGADSEKWQKKIAELSDIMEQNPNTMFEILLPFPQLTYWCNREQTFKAELDVYGSFVECLESAQNVKLYYLGDEEWLICNERHYTSDFGVNADMAKHIFLSAFCDGNYQVNGDSIRNKLSCLSDKIAAERVTPTQYPDLSGYSIVFIGDSIVGLDRSTASIPQIVSTLSGADTYNLAQGGLTATKVEDRISFLTIVDALEKPDDTQIQEEEVWKGIQEFQQRETNENKLVFVIAFGLNDYFQGERVKESNNPLNPQTYYGALRLGTERLKALYPDAEVVIMAPTYTNFYSHGNEYMSEQGGILEDYRLAAKEVADVEKVLFKNQYEDLKVFAENEILYLTDGCHLTQQGKFVYGINMIEYLGEVLDDWED
ncbi:MAG: SGNH/GDSL hydrolase family protein [Lachnospiraceae bacterium]|nr:SGNH/GDSL hydrolase family protein [Lachnospiraceae bacterium]